MARPGPRRRSGGPRRLPNIQQQLQPLAPNQTPRRPPSRGRIRVDSPRRPPSGGRQLEVNGVIFDSIGRRRVAPRRSSQPRGWPGRWYARDFRRRRPSTRRFAADGRPWGVAWAFVHTRSSTRSPVQASVRPAPGPGFARSPVPTGRQREPVAQIGRMNAPRGAAVGPIGRTNGPAKAHNSAIAPFVWPVGAVVGGRSPERTAGPTPGRGCLDRRVRSDGPMGGSTAA